MFSDQVTQEIKALVPDYRVHLLEPKKIVNWDSFKTDVGILFEMISVSDERNGMKNLIENNPQKYSNVNNDIVRAVNQFTKGDIPINEDKEETNMCYAMQTTREEARSEGMETLMDTYTWLIFCGREEDAAAMMKKENSELRERLLAEYSAKVNHDGK